MGGIISIESLIRSDSMISLSSRFFGARNFSETPNYAKDNTSAI